MADCLESNGNFIEKGNYQNSIKFKNDTNINIYKQFKVEGNVLENISVSNKNYMISG